MNKRQRKKRFKRLHQKHDPTHNPLYVDSEGNSPYSSNKVRTYHELVVDDRFYPHTFDDTGKIPYSKPQIIGVDRIDMPEFEPCRRPIIIPNGPHINTNLSEEEKILFTPVDSTINNTIFYRGADKSWVEQDDNNDE